MTIKNSVRLILLAAALTFGNVAYAQETPEEPAPNAPASCEGYWVPFSCIYNQIRASFSAVNIQRTVVNSAFSMSTDVPSQMTFGRNPDQLRTCLTMIGSPNATVPPDQLAELGDDDCSDLQVATVVTGKYGYPTQFRSRGSLMGMAGALQDIATHEPVPVNLAFYAKHTAAKIPVINQTAFAQDVPEIGNFTLQAVMGVWEKIRNLSYGALAVFMVAIGVMVMFRQKINPQTVVTVQAAIPRVIIAVILITFSYPIVAFAIQLITPVASLALGLLDIDALYSSTPGGQHLAGLPFHTLVGMLSLFAMGDGVTGGFLGLLVWIGAVVVQLILFIKVLIQLIAANLKLVLAALTGPLIFAWGAIPGNEEATTNWAKGVIVSVITIPTMIFTIGLAYYMAVHMTGYYASQSFTGPATFGAFSQGSALARIGAPFIVIFILVKAGQVPQMLEEMILGETGGKKKKK